MLQVIDAGGQAALLAPTEVLAQQHYRSITDLLGPLGQAGRLGGAEQATRVALLTGSQGAAARREALLDAASGAAGIVIGTHALLTEQVQFADLGMVVIDEQHRFGVEQRDALREKAEGSAPARAGDDRDPDPAHGRHDRLRRPGHLHPDRAAGRPLADRHPRRARRRRSPTTWRGRGSASGRRSAAGPPGLRRLPADRRRGRRRPGGGADGRLTADADGPERCLAEDEEDAGPRRPPLAVLDLAPALAEGPLAGLRLRVLHGRLPPRRRTRRCARSPTGSADVLVATTVVEVGVDVPNATVMVVMDADRFGVSQLHQLRGRVGRGSEPGLCLLVTEAPEGTKARDRLDAVAATLDGFRLARLDLEQRREGDVLGAAQAGRKRSLKLLTLLSDEALIGQARRRRPPWSRPTRSWPASPALAAAIGSLLDEEQAEFLEKT